MACDPWISEVRQELELSELCAIRSRINTLRQVRISSNGLEFLYVKMKKSNCLEILKNNVLG